MEKQKGSGQEKCDVAKVEESRVFGTRTYAKITEKISMQRGKEMRTGKKRMRICAGLLVLLSVLLTGCGQLEI